MYALPSQAQDILEERNPGFRYVKSWQVVEETEEKTTYSVRFCEVVEGTKGEDTDTFDVEKPVTKREEYTPSTERTITFDHDQNRYFDSDEYGGYPSHW